MKIKIIIIFIYYISDYILHITYQKSKLNLILNLNILFFLHEKKKVKKIRI